MEKSGNSREQVGTSSRRLEAAVWQEETPNVSHQFGECGCGVTKESNKSKSRVWRTVMWFTRKGKSEKERSCSCGVADNGFEHGLEGRSQERWHSKSRSFTRSASRKFRISLRKQHGKLDTSKNSFRSYHQRACCESSKSTRYCHPKPDSPMATGSFCDFGHSCHVSPARKTRNASVLSGIARELNPPVVRDIFRQPVEQLSESLSSASVCSTPFMSVAQSPMSGKGVRRCKSYSGPFSNTFPFKRRNTGPQAKTHGAISPPLKQKCYGLRRTATFSGKLNTEFTTGHVRVKKSKSDNTANFMILEKVSSFGEIKDQDGSIIGIVHFYKSPKNCCVRRLGSFTHGVKAKSMSDNTEVGGASVFQKKLESTCSMCETGQLCDHTDKANSVATLQRQGFLAQKPQMTISEEQEKSSESASKLQEQSCVGDEASPLSGFHDGEESTCVSCATEGTTIFSDALDAKSPLPKNVPSKSQHQESLSEDFQKSSGLVIKSKSVPSVCETGEMINIPANCLIQEDDSVSIQGNVSGSIDENVDDQDISKTDAENTVILPTCALSGIINSVKNEDESVLSVDPFSVCSEKDQICTDTHRGQSIAKESQQTDNHCACTDEHLTSKDQTFKHANKSPKTSNEINICNIVDHATSDSESLPQMPDNLNESQNFFERLKESDGGTNTVSETGKLVHSKIQHISVDVQNGNANLILNSQRDIANNLCQDMRINSSCIINQNNLDNDGKKCDIVIEKKVEVLDCQTCDAKYGTNVPFFEPSNFAIGGDDGIDEHQALLTDNKTLSSKHLLAEMQIQEPGMVEGLQLESLTQTGSTSNPLACYEIVQDKTTSNAWTTDCFTGREEANSTCTCKCTKKDKKSFARSPDQVSKVWNQASTCEEVNRSIPNNTESPFAALDQSSTSDYVSCVGEDLANQSSATINTWKTSDQSQLTYDDLGLPVPGHVFKKRTELILSWFQDFNDEQKNIVMKKLLNRCELPQMHLLSVAMEHNLHKACPPNCQDMLVWLPYTVTLKILMYLDVVSLCRCNRVNRAWNELTNNPLLWQQLARNPDYQLSEASSRRQYSKYTQPNDEIHWKKVLAERFLLQRNWLNGKYTLRTYEGHNQGIACVQFDDTRIVSGSSDKTIKLWDISNTPSELMLTLEGHSGTVRCLDLNGNRLVSGSTDRTIKVWDLSFASYWAGASCKVTMVGHLHTVRCLQADDKKLVSGSYDKTVKVWDLKTGQCKLTLRGHTAAVLCVQFDDQKIVSGSYDKKIKVWDLSQGTCLMTLDGHQDAVTCLNLTHDGMKIITGSLDYSLKFWDLLTGKCYGTLDWITSEGHTAVVRCLQVDGWRIISGGDDKTLKVWELATGQRLLTLRYHSDGVTCMQFNDFAIVSGSYDRTVKLWDFTPKHPYLDSVT